MLKSERLGDEGGSNKTKRRQIASWIDRGREGESNEVPEVKRDGIERTLEDVQGAPDVEIVGKMIEPSQISLPRPEAEICALHGIGFGRVGPGATEIELIPMLRSIDVAQIHSPPRVSV